MNFILIRINKKQIPQGGGRNNNWSLRLKRGSLLYRVSEIGHGLSTLLCYLQPFYLINYGVIQGFLALRKAFHTWKNIVFFHGCLISPISCWYVIRLSRHSVGLMNERQSRHDSQYRVIWRNFFRIMAAKTQKNSYRSLTVTFKLS